MEPEYSLPSQGDTIPAAAASQTQDHSPQRVMEDDLVGFDQKKMLGMKPEYSLHSATEDTTEQNPAPAPTQDQPLERSDDMIMELEGDLENFRQKKTEMFKTLDKITEEASSVVEFSHHLEELEKNLNSKGDLLREKAMQVELKEESVMERILEVEKKEERLREVEKEVELLSKSNDEKSYELEKTMKEFDLKQKKWIEKKKKEAEQIEASLLQLVEKENELRSLDAVFKDKWTKIESFEAKLKAREEEMELKSKFLELKEKKLEKKEKELEERSAKRHKPLRKAHGESDGIGEDLPKFDSEFNDFGKTMRSFLVGQVWSIYDHVDRMPRVYARIKEVNESELSLLMTRLELQNEEHVPVGCGRFKYGATETISHLMFSHEMHVIRRGKNFIAVYPRKGETWALFGDWNKSWNSNPEQHKQPYRYEFVEIEQDFDKVKGIGVAYLGKVEGFISIFQHAGKEGILQIMFPADEMNRFSHRIPSFKMNGNEKEGVPADSFELDPAAIPSSVLNLTHGEDKEEEIKDCGEVGDVKDPADIIILD